MCPVLPRPSPCPDQPNECSGESECSAGQKCCSDGCRMVCADPVAKPTTQPPSTDCKFIKGFFNFIIIYFIVISLIKYFNQATKTNSSILQAILAMQSTY